MKKIIIFLTITIFILEIVNIYYANKISTDSLYAADIQAKISEFGEKNDSLNTEILNYASLHAISAKAKQLGYISQKEFIVLSAPLELALKHD